MDAKGDSVPGELFKKMLKKINKYIERFKKQEIKGLMTHLIDLSALLN